MASSERSSNVSSAMVHCKWILAAVQCHFDALFIMTFESFFHTSRYKIYDVLMDLGESLPLFASRLRTWSYHGLFYEDLVLMLIINVSKFRIIKSLLHANNKEGNCINRNEHFISHQYERNYLPRQQNLMLLNCGAGKDSWESLGLQGDPTSLSKGNQFWIFIGRTDAEAETPILWPHDAKNWLIGKDPDAGKDWRQEEKGMTGWVGSTLRLYGLEPTRLLQP